jgi:protein-S-isoprenylcysteine O-methyltransferase Ste14
MQLIKESIEGDGETMLQWRHIRSILLLPFTVTILIPTLLLASSRSLAVGWALPMPWRLALIVVGLLSIGAGLRLLVQTIRLFATQGHGTLAPWDPPTHLVVRGVYRHVRNPMISGVISVLLGESILLGLRPLALWCALFTGVNLLVIPLYEEPQLEERFGAEYAEYKQHVPRWIPRARPWHASWEHEA